MALDAYLNLGGNEIVNSARAVGYQQTGDCRIAWTRCDCPELGDALGDGPYTYDRINLAPWYDPDLADLSARFLGASVISIDGIDDSTRQAVMTQKAMDGGQVSGYRHGTKAVRVRAMLTGRGQDALDYGMTWLRSALEPGACGVHSVSCGTTSLEFLVACPEPGASADDVDTLRRYLHGVVCTSGPLVQQRRVSNDGQHYGAIVEFTLEAESAFVYSVQREVALPPVTPVVVQDVVYNLAPYPSAELASGTVVMATNYSTNPSVESNTNGWIPTAGGGFTPNPPSGARSTELSAVGTASYKVSAVATNSGTGGYLRANQTVSIASAPAGARVSVNVWGAFFLLAGTAVISELRGYLQFRDSGAAIISTMTLGVTPVSGGTLSLANIPIPSGAVDVVVIVSGNLSSWSPGASLALYADALALTNP